MTQPALPVPLGFPIVGVVGGEPFTSDGGWISKGFVGNVTVRLEGNSSGLCSVSGLETFRLEHNAELPANQRSWESVDKVDGPGPIGVLNNTFLDITVRLVSPTEPVPGDFQLSAVVVGGNGPLVSLPIEATSFSPAPPPPSVIVKISINPVNPTIRLGSFGLPFKAFPTLSDGFFDDQNPVSGVIWASSIPGVATIDANGIANAVSDFVHLPTPTLITANFTTTEGLSLVDATNLVVEG